MDMRFIVADEGPDAVGGYSQAVEVTNITRRLYISGQIPEEKNGYVPATFEEQAKLVWKNIFAQLNAADMAVENIVKVTTFLSDRKYRDENGTVRKNVLGNHRPALTVLIAGIYDEQWLLEIEVIAEA